MVPSPFSYPLRRPDLVRGHLFVTVLLCFVFFFFWNGLFFHSVSCNEVLQLCFFLLVTLEGCKYFVISISLSTIYSEISPI